MGILASLGSLSVLLAGNAAGILADRKRRRPLLVGVNLGQAVILATLPLAALAHVLTLGQVFAVTLLAGMLGATVGLRGTVIVAGAGTLLSLVWLVRAPK